MINSRKHKARGGKWGAMQSMFSVYWAASTTRIFHKTETKLARILDHSLILIIMSGYPRVGGQKRGDSAVMEGGRGKGMKRKQRDGDPQLKRRNRRDAGGAEGSSDFGHVGKALFFVCLSVSYFPSFLLFPHSFSPYITPFF